MIPTKDPNVMIEDVGAGWVIYRHASGERWIIRGVCNCCGECEIGATNPDIIWTGGRIGQPWAAVDRRWGARRDVPVRPEGPGGHWPSCTLSGEYLTHA